MKQQRFNLSNNIYFTNDHKNEEKIIEQVKSEVLFQLSRTYDAQID